MAKKRYKYLAIAYGKGDYIVSTGVNRYDKSHPKQAHFAKQAKKPEKIFLHAEIDALIKAREKVYSIQVLKQLPNGEYIETSPCSICQLALKEYKIKFRQGVT